MMLSFALILSYVESLLPLAAGIPGVKLGLANLAVLLCLYLYGWKMALFIDIARVALAGFLFGNLFAILYSLAGALLSFLVMALLKKGRFRMGTVSIGGGVSHNIGQLAVAAVVVETGNVFFYLSWLMFAGIATGAAIGAVCSGVYSSIKNLKEREKL